MLGFPFFLASGVLTISSVLALFSQKEVAKGVWVNSLDWKVSAILLWVAVVSALLGAFLSHCQLKWKS